MPAAPTSLRALLGGDGVIAAPGVHDAFTARIVEQAGHRAAYLGGNAMALGLGKGQPFLTLSETVDLTARVARTVGIPLLVDAGAGFGAAAHLHLAVREIEGAGAAGLHIDDQPYPKMASYHRGQGTLVEAAGMAERLRVATMARRNEDLVIVARTDALRVTKSLDEVVDRCGQYVEAGADALMVLDLGPEQSPKLREAFPRVPLVWIGGVVPPVPSLAALENAGFRLACYPFNTVAEITTRLGDLWGRLARTGEVDQSSEMLARAKKETLDLVDMRTLWDIEDEFGQKA
ncbi:MAG: isocitrate lyase/PEP mutase family protein [Allosphingosinicella sp.]